ncbi:MAG: class I SAM-dependent methyltransferase [candidate division Zixibacteria bacterium]|nr:class I SAM-dependent methyltransferase [candidate division Zixibacteria bacterium]
MAQWDNYFADEDDISRIPQVEVCEFAADLEKCIDTRPLRIWDLCCGAGRHTIALARIGHEVYASDGSVKGIDLTRLWLQKAGHSAETAVAEMTVCPWKEISFHGVICWDSLHHNTIDNIRKTVEEIRLHTVPNGMFMANVISVRSMGHHDTGREIEPHTFVNDDGHEAGIPHHFFDENRLRNLLEKWEILVLAEQVVSYKERSQNTPRVNPFSYSFWGFVVRNLA